jgi:putative flippase GtrA
VLEGGLKAFLKFGGLSGLGWLADFVLLLGLTSLPGAPAGPANFVSSSIAALGVFLVSRKAVFAGVEGALELRVVGYLLYAFCVIVAAAAAMGAIAEALSRWAEVSGLACPSWAIVAAAKVFVTPPQLAMNFFMSRYVSQFRIEPGWRR